MDKLPHCLFGKRFFLPEVPARKQDRGHHSIIRPWILTSSSTPSEQELKFGDTCFVPVLGKISTAMRWHRLEILTTQWCEADGSGLQFLSGWSTSFRLAIFLCVNLLYAVPEDGVCTRGLGRAAIHCVQRTQASPAGPTLPFFSSPCAV